MRAPFDTAGAELSPVGAATSSSKNGSELFLDGEVAGVGRPTSTWLLRVLGVALKDLKSLSLWPSLGLSRLFGPGDASRESVCKNDDFRFLSEAFSASSRMGRGRSGRLTWGYEPASLRWVSAISDPVRVRVRWCVGAVKRHNRKVRFNQRRNGIN